VKSESAKRKRVLTPLIEMVPFEKALLSSYSPFIVTFHLSLRVSEILPLLCSSTPLLPTPPLISPKFPHAPWATKSEDVGLIVRAISLQDFQPNLADAFDHRVHPNTIPLPLQIWEKRERGRIQGLPTFFEYPLAITCISGSGNATNFKFCVHIHRLYYRSEQKPIKNFRKST